MCGHAKQWKQTTTNYFPQLHTGLFGSLVLPKGFDLAIIEQAELAEGYSYFADVSTFPLKTGNFQENNIVTSDGKIIQMLLVQPFVLSLSDRY